MAERGACASWRTGGGPRAAGQFRGRRCRQSRKWRRGGDDATPGPDRGEEEHLAVRGDHDPPDHSAVAVAGRRGSGVEEGAMRHRVLIVEKKKIFLSGGTTIRLIIPRSPLPAVAEVA